MSSVEAVVFDLGGVVMDSPLHAIARYERSLGFEPNTINRAIRTAGDEGAWSRLERGELNLDQFYAPFEADLRAQGLEVNGIRLMAYVGEAAVPRPSMLEAIRRIRARSLRVAALTNNWVTREARPGSASLREMFDVFVESSRVGLRKPDPRIYRLVCHELGVEPPRAVFLDDIGQNLKSARALGMITIKVDDPGQALGELGAMLGFDLVA